MTAFQIFDVLLALGLTLRLVRLIIIDDLGLWYLRGPAAMWANQYIEPLPTYPPHGSLGWVEAGELDISEQNAPKLDWRVKMVSGLDCPFCVGFWIGCLVLLSLWLVGGPGDAAEPWRWIAGAFTLNWVAAHIGSRLEVDGEE